MKLRIVTIACIVAALYGGVFVGVLGALNSEEWP